ncbi:MAG: DUF4040 domain-containing protein [Candidatus Schekmanbacteria bacterium]|nr:DUF4040 domain-containing protein [Candidatus Schekmanbacteria bacterium]
MSTTLELILLLFLIIIALAVTFTKDLLMAVLIFSVYSFVLVIIWEHLGAPDVALIEAVAGVGITTIFFILAITHTGRREE